MPDPKTIDLVDDIGVTRAVPESEVQYHLDRGWHPESADERSARLASEVESDVYGGAAGTALAGAAGLARGVTGGGSDVLIAGLGGGEQLEKLRRQNPLTSTLTEIGGALSPTGIGGLAERAGVKVAGTGGGALASIARTGAKTAVEGGILGAGQGVSELALSDDPLTTERIASVIGSNVLFGAGTGGAIGAAGKGLEVGLRRAQRALDGVAGRGIASTTDVGADLATLDGKGLRAARKAEEDAIETTRVTQRSEVADEIKALRSEMKEQKVWLATKDADVKAIKEVREIGKVAFEADKSIDRMLRNPKALAQRPQRVLDGLQQQEHALERLVGQGDNLRTVFAKDASGTRAAALDYASTALEKNRALQGKIEALTAKPSSPRLDAIAEHLEMRAMPKAPQSIGDMLGASALGHAVGMAAGVPYLGQAVLGAKAIGGVMKKLGANSAEAAARVSKGISTFLSVGAKVAPSAPVVATKVLSAARYAQGDKPKRGTKEPQHTLASAYKARSEEIRSQIAPAMDGSLQMRPAAREQVAARLAPIRAVNPLLADRIETQKARAMEFLAGKLPRRPDFGGIPTGPDKWQPSDMEMRTWARYVAAVEDPHSIVERLADGSVTPEDVETMREVFPEMHADIVKQVIEQLPTLQKQLPYQRRLALSMFTGVPVDPTMHPVVLAALQASYAEEPGSEGGMQAPKAEPAFGSVKSEAATPSQQRAG